MAKKKTKRINPLTRLFKILDMLEAFNLPTRLRRSRDDAIEICVLLGACEVWEIEIFPNGEIESQFGPGGDILDTEETFERLEKEFDEFRKILKGEE